MIRCSNRVSKVVKLLCIRIDTFMELAVLLTTFISPFLPHLLKLGEPIAEEAGKKLGAELGESSWETAKKVWNKIASKVKEKPIAQGAVAAVAEDLCDEDAQAILTKQLEKLLIDNPSLSQSLQKILISSDSVSQAVTVTQTVTGNKNIVIGEADGFVNISQY